MNRNFIILLITYLASVNTQVNAFRVFDVNGVETILALQFEDIKIQCKTDRPMAYCGFRHPSGKRYSFSGPTLSAGNCAITVKATTNDSGEWRCHIGSTGIGVEIVQLIRVRVVTELAAVQPNITAVHGKPITLMCATTKNFTPLMYCRFEPPVGAPFSIDSTVTQTNPILNRYYYPSNKSLDRGDCAVTISKVRYEDVGAWTCGAGLDDDKEHTDIIVIDVEGLYTISKASATGITFGVIGVFGFLLILAMVAWKRRTVFGRSHEPEPAEIHELEELRRSPHASPRAERVPRVVVQSPSEPRASPLHE